MFLAMAPRRGSRSPHTPSKTISTKRPDMEYKTPPEAARAIRGTQKTVLFMCLYIIYIYNIYIYIYMYK